MTNSHAFFKSLQKLALSFVIFSVFMQCSEEDDILLSKGNANAVSPDTTSLPALDPNQDCSDCTFIVPADSMIIDGRTLGLKPGSVICLNSRVNYGTLEFQNIVGTEEEPIIIRNCGGQVNIRATEEGYAVKTYRSKHFRITGGSTPGNYGINIQGGVMGLTMEFLSTNFEVDHVEISNVRFAGIIAKTDPTCNDSTIRENFTMYDVSLHDNYVHETGGEGFYVGNSFYAGMERQCGKRLPHEIKGLKIFNNKVNNSGWEAIQVGCAIEGSEIFNNTITNYGTVNKLYQNNGIQIGSGTGGLVYNNFIKKGTGNGMIIMGTGDNVVYNNIIIDTGSNGIFCDERFTPGEGFKFINNTILNPKMDGIRLFAELVPMNTIVNNIIAEPGSYGTYAEGRTTDDSFVYLESSNVKLRMSNNLFVNSLAEIQFIDPAKDNYRLKHTSPAVNYGSDISRFQIEHDFYQAQRLKGSAYDIGASEY